MSDRLSKETLAELRDALERKRAEISSQSKRALDEIRDKEDRKGDSVDESTQEQGATSLLRLKDREKNFLTKINTALERMDNGEYGLCVECEEPIPQKRLEARPAAVLCIDCKEEREQAESRQKKRPGLMDDFPSG